MGSTVQDDDGTPQRPSPNPFPGDPYLLWLENALEEGRADLKERVKELACLFAVDRALRRADLQWRTSLQEIVDVLPSGFRSPAQISARIRLGNDELMTEGFRGTEWRLARRIIAEDDLLGEVEVTRSHPPKEGENAFSLEEESLLASVADRLAEAMGRIRAEDELRRGQAFQKALIRAAPIPLFSVGRDGKVLVWNPAAEQVFGWPAEEVCGNSLPILGEEDREEFTEMRRRASQGETLAGVHFTCRTHDGSPIAVLLSISPVRLAPDDAQPSAVFFAVEDFSDQEGIWTTKRFQARLLDSVGQAVIATDLRGRIVYWNRAAESIYGWRSTDVMGRDILDVTPSPGLEAEAESITEVVRSGEHWTGEFEVRHRDGSTFPALVTNAPIHDEHDRFVGVVSVSSDISRTRNLEAQLRQSQKMEALGVLAGGIAHDFNNLLTVIQGHVELMLGGLPSNSPLHEDMQEVISATHRATRLTRPLLALGRRQVGAERAVDLRTCLAEIEPLLRRLIPSRIEVRVDPGSMPATVKADPSQLDQIIMNLAVNAVDAVERSGAISFGVDRCTITPESSLSGPWEAPPGTYARFTVKDTGTGMSPEVAERIFEPFFTTKAAGHGTGLGLSTVFGIVGQGGGHLRLSTEPGVGTTFEILWPLVEGEGSGEGAGEESGERPGPVEPGPNLRSQLAGAATVLVVDDGPAVRKVIRRTLERSGYHVLTAENGTDAIALQEEHAGRIRLVICDVVMPQMGGIELLTHLEETSPGLPVVLTSGYPDREMGDGIRSRASGFLQKPFGPGDLVRLVEEILDA
ncbi:MAG: PAS domain-containing sensor histidine kinase [Gemmatimonadales bacterium]|nr:MAG: PAS domain-containing sensor histidine kinase [Gemmatimonadales bacterium]